MAEKRGRVLIVQVKTTCQLDGQRAALTIDRGHNITRIGTFRSILRPVSQVLAGFYEDRLGADVNYAQYQSKISINGVKMSLLMLACKKSKIHVVETLLKDPHIQLFHRDQNGKNAVHYTLQNPDETEAEPILKRLLAQQPLLVICNSCRKKWATILKVTTSLWLSEKENQHFSKFFYKKTLTQIFDLWKVKSMKYRFRSTPRGCQSP